MGPALREYEAEQAAWNARVAQEKKNRGLRSPLFIPLRGLRLIGYYTLIPEVQSLPHLGRGHATPGKSHRLVSTRQAQERHKGIKARGPFAAELVDYLAAIRPANASGPIHINRSTGEPYVDIRKQWDRLAPARRGEDDGRYQRRDRERTLLQTSSLTSCRKWCSVRNRPDVPVPPSASLTAFGAEQTPICDAPLALAS